MGVHRERLLVPCGKKFIFSLCQGGSFGSFKATPSDLSAYKLDYPCRDRSADPIDCHNEFSGKLRLRQLKYYLLLVEGLLLMAQCVQLASLFCHLLGRFTLKGVHSSYKILS